MRKHEILIVEDDGEMALALRDGFELDRYAVTVASDGEEALNLAQRQRFDAIVLDVMLPALDGYSVTTALRGSGDRTPILMLTARDSVADKVYGFQCGAEDYLTKPFSFLELSARVQSLIRRSRPPVTRFQLADLVLDCETLEVFRGGRAVHLTPTEFRLLQMLMTNAGRVVRRHDLIHPIWGSAAADNNNIDVAVSALRAKVDRGRSFRLIQTVRGFGYRLAEPQS